MSPLCFSNWIVSEIKPTTSNSVIGRRVWIKAYQTEGKVQSLTENGDLRVVDSDGFTWKCKESMILFLDEDVRQKQKMMASTCCIAAKREHKQHETLDAIRKPVIVDLHRYAIGRTPWEKLQRQLQEFQDTLESYKGKHNCKLVFINGNGIEDKLRKEMILVLNRMNSLYRYCDGHDVKYRFHTALEVTVK